MLKVQSHKSNTLLSKAIRFFSRGDCSHISIEIGGYVYEAVWDKGVVKTERAIWDNSTVCKSVYLNITKSKEKEVTDFLEKQVGKQYDFSGVFSFIWRYLNEKDGAWFCSEIGTVALLKGKGVPRKIIHKLQRKSPDECITLAELLCVL